MSTSSPARWVHCDARGVVVRASPRFAEWVGAEVAAISGTPLSRWWRTDGDARVLDGASVSRRREVEVGGDRIAVIEERYPRVDDRGEICGVTLVVREVESPSHLASVIAASPDAIVVLDREGRYREVISEGAAGLSVPPERALGRRVRDVHPQIADAVEATLRRAIDTGEIQQLEYEVAVASGSRRFSARAVALGKPPDPPVLWVTRDVTHRHRAEQTRRLFEKQEAESQKLESLGLLAGGIAHDFNNLLVSILANANYARSQIRNQLGDESLRDIESAASRAAGLCRQLLAYTGGTRLITGPVELNGLIREVVAGLGNSFGDAIEIELQLERDVMMVDCDRAHVRNVIRDLIKNSAEAIDGSGSITLSTGSREVTSDELSRSRADALISEGRYCVIEVSDSGCGMPEELAHRAFEPFFSTKFRGRGLGLAAAVGIMRAHKGAIVLDSEPGAGSSVRLYFPERARGRLSAVEPAAEPGGGHVVLLVDDDELIRNVGTRILESVDYRVITAADGGEGVERYREVRESIDCVIMDLTMPILHGTEAARQIREIDRSVPLILSSGYAEKDYSNLIAADPRMWFLQKPYRANQLVYAVRRALAPDSARRSAAARANRS